MMGPGAVDPALPKHEVPDAMRRRQPTLVWNERLIVVGTGGTSRTIRSDVQERRSRQRAGAVRNGQTKRHDSDDYTPARCGTSVHLPIGTMHPAR
ncbi:hypothetical protein [Microvirga pudoricolor]|uniref:hypothetical protein n=1 Tax=Microvirga pudoricolor TaxID=2778729 RepID=UPI001950DED2|nr:hypothetical protein [Microvirga pudoricolor]MBM6593610.1 hypothetical protein [Microvirga pudoricolor]